MLPPKKHAVQVTAPAYLTGAVYGLSAVSIWAGWSAFTRLAVTTKLDAWDITALRFGVAALQLLPVIFRSGMALDRLAGTVATDRRRRRALRHAC